MNKFQISIMQGDFVYQSSLVSAEPILFEEMSRKAISTLIKGMLIARMDYNSASVKDKAGNIILRRPKSNLPFEVYIEQIVENEPTKVLVSDSMKFNLTEKSISKTLLSMPKRLWLMVNDKLIGENPLLALKPMEYYGTQAVN